MPFRLPSLRASGQGDLPTQPRKLRRWLSELPLVNMGEATRQFYQGLRILNETRLSPGARLELMELMRPMAGTVLTHLGRHFVNRTLPLPEKSRRIAELNRVILSELAIGYGQAVRDLLKSGRPRGKTLALAAYRAMRYTGQILQNSWRLYEPAPSGIWREIYQLYQAAEARGAHDIPVMDETLHGQGRGTVSGALKKICLLALTHPLSLRQGETDRVADFLDTVGASAVISENPMADSTGGVHVVNLDTDDAPAYLRLADTPRGPHVRALNLAPLARDIRETIQGGVRHNGFEMSADLSHRLLEGWMRSARRRFSRANRDDEVNVAIGLGNIYATIERDMAERAAGDRGDSTDLTLQYTSGELSGRRGHDGDGNEAGFLAAADPVGYAEVWDAVARGNVITETHARRPHSPPITALGLGTRDAAQAEPWQLINASPGGFCLRWRGQRACRAQVGELIGLREKEGNQYQWRVGVIRWMLNKAEGGLEVGVQVLAPRTVLVRIEPPHPVRSNATPGQALLLPAIRTIQQPPTLVVPAGRFQVGEEVIVSLAGRAMRLRLEGLGEHTSLFAQHRYTSMGQPQPVAESAHESPRQGAEPRFDDLWMLI
jgi:cyclic-di-GMP-binding protein